jgi:hypothetical protein
MAKKRYIVNGEHYTIPFDKDKEFRNTYPDAEEVHSYDVDGEAYHIPVSQEPDFLRDKPSAKALGRPIDFVSKVPSWIYEDTPKKKDISDSTSEVQASESKLDEVPQPTQDGFRTVQPHKLASVVEANQQTAQTKVALKSMLPQIEKTIEDIDNKAKAHIGDNAIFGFGKEQDDLLTARRYLQKVNKMIKAPSEEGFKSFVSGLRRNDLANFMSLGYADAYRYLKTTKLARRIAAGDEPTDEESLLLSGRYLYDLANANLDKPSSYVIGSAIAEMAPFLGQLYLTGPVGSGAATVASNATKKLIYTEAVNVLKKFGLDKVLKTATAAAAQTPLTAMFFQKYAEERMPLLEMGEDGKVYAVKDSGGGRVDAVTDAFGSTMSTIFSEKIGFLIEGKVSSLGKKLAGTIDEPAKAIKSITQFKKDANWNGMLTEFLEEQVDNVGQAVTTEEASLSDIFDSKRQFETLATIMVASGAMKALEIPGYFKEKHYKKELEKATELFEKSVDPQTRKVIDSAINMDSVDDMQARLKDEDVSHLTPDQQKITLGYMQAKLGYNTLFEAANTKLEPLEGEKTKSEPKVSPQKESVPALGSEPVNTKSASEIQYEESIAKKSPEVIAKMPTFQGKKFSLATILPNGDISNVYVRSEGESHKTYMTPEDQNAYEEGRMALRFWNGTTFAEAPQKGREYGTRVMELAASKVLPPVETKTPEIEVLEATKSNEIINIGEQQNAVQESSSNEMGVRQQEAVGEGMGGGNAEPTIPTGESQEAQAPQEALEKGIRFKDRVYTTEQELKDSLSNKEITIQEHDQAVSLLRKADFDKSKDRLRNALGGLANIKNAIGDEAVNPLTETYDALVDFIKNAVRVYGDKIRSAKDVAKYTGTKYNATMQQAFDEAVGKKVVDNEKKMRGFPKRIKEFEQFKDIKIDIEQNPELRYDPQVLADIKEKVGSMSPEQLVAASNPQGLEYLSDGEDNVAVMAYIERINRARANNEDVMPIVEEVSRKGTMWGQLIRQFGELKGSTSEGLLTVFEKSLAKQGRFLTEEQKAKFLELSGKDIEARQKLKDQSKLAQVLPSEENINQYDKLKNEAESAYVDMAKYMQELTPKNFWDMMGMAMQGNLLTPMSQVTNIFANLMNIPITGSANTMASFMDRLHTMFTGSERVTTLDPRAMFEGVKGFGRGVKEAAKQIKTGVPINDKMEISRGFQPLRSMQQAFSGKDIPLSAKGRVELSDRVNKFIEGLVGFPAETMFRLLNLGDKPFYRMAEGMTLYRIGKAKGLKGDALQNFIRFPSDKAQAQAEKSAKEATFQEEGRMSKAATSVANTLRNAVPFGAWRFLMRTQMPYIKTPANIISQTLDIALPPLSMAKGVYEAYKGNKKESLVNLGKAGVGLIIAGGARYLLEHGLMSGSADKEKKVRGLQYDSFPPNSVNISGLNRLASGGDPSYQEGDEVMNYTKMGLVGMAFGVQANIYEREKDIQKESPNKLSDYSRKMIATLLETPSYALEQSFLQGTSSLLTAIKDKEWDYWLTNTFKAVSSIALPNTLDAANRATREYIPDLKGDDLPERLSNVIRNKLWMTENLPITRNLWGEKILQNPEGSNGWLYQMFNVAKMQELQAKPESKLIHDLYVKTQDPDVIPSVPMRSLTIESKKRELNSREYERYIELVGAERKALLQSYVNDPSFKAKSDEDKIRWLKWMWDQGQKKGKAKFLNE